MKKRVDFYNTSLWILFKKELLKVINEEENVNTQTPFFKRIVKKLYQSFIKSN